MQRFAVFGMFLLACGGGGSGGVPLDNTITCGTFDCNSGQLCRTQSSGVDAFSEDGGGGGGGGSRSCVTPPPGCLVFECSGVGDCQPCILEMCGFVCSSCSVTLEGRNLICPAGF